MFRSFAVVPAAGRSARMGAPKLLLPLGSRPIIDHVLDAWTASAVTRTVVVVRAGDSELLDRCRAFDVDVVAPSEPPPDMKSSVQLALRHIAASYAPREHDVWLVAPADLPGLDGRVINQLLAAYDPATPTAVAPTYRGRRGHPTLLAWSMASDVEKLPADEGVNAIVARTPLREVPWDSPAVLDDVDAPGDYRRLRAVGDDGASGKETGRA